MLPMLDQCGSRAYPGYAYLINEYCWLWLYSDGTPMGCAESVYSKAMPNSTAKERLEVRWYLAAAETEMWRTQRCAAGVLFYSYFGSSLRRKPGPYHYGAFADVASLRLQPEFEKYMIEAFKPLGVYINFWGDGKPGSLLCSPVVSNSGRFGTSFLGRHDQ